MEYKLKIKRTESALVDRVLKALEEGGLITLEVVENTSKSSVNGHGDGHGRELAKYPSRTEKGVFHHVSRARTPGSVQCTCKGFLHTGHCRHVRHAARYLN